MFETTRCPTVCSQVVHVSFVVVCTVCHVIHEAIVHMSCRFIPYACVLMMIYIYISCSFIISRCRAVVGGHQQ